MLTTKKIDTGVFDVLWNGTPTKWEITNGSNGLTGRDTINTYIIVSPKGKQTSIGSLQTCKRLLADRFTKTPPL